MQIKGSLRVCSLPFRTFTAATTQKEQKFDYKSLDFYQLLNVKKQVLERDLKGAYFKLAKQYHPDVYKGVNQEHFRRISEAYNTLKNPLKRQEYDQKIKIRAQKEETAQPDFTQAEETKVRDTVDPEFEEAFKKMNTSRLFDQFMARPIRSDPRELQEQIMQPEHFKKMSRRDKARMDFVRGHRKRAQINNSVRHQINEQLDFMEDIESGAAGLKQMNYSQLVEELNKDAKALSHIENPLTLYKDEKAAIAEVIQKQDEQLREMKKYVYPFWSIALLVNGMLLVGYYQQEKQIKIGARRIENQEKFESYLN